MVPTDHQLLGVFRSFMQAGYAKSPPKTTVKELPGSKLITFEQGDFLATDLYFTNPDSIFSNGTTMIYCERKPAWFMSYWGWYDKHDISFLKEALRKNYDEGIFMGGRGPHRFEKGSRIYINEYHGGFGKFSGAERLEKAGDPDILLGKHEYFGGLLIDNDEIPLG